MTDHVRTPAGVARYHLPIGSPIGGGSHGVKDEVSRFAPNPRTVNLNNRDYTLDGAVRLVGSAYDWRERDAEGASRADRQSIHEQDKAQIVAKAWAESTSGDDPVDDQYAASLWQEYQSPHEYGLINGTLRGQHKPDEGEPDAATLRKYADRMFEEGGYTTEKPMTVYRALKANVLPTEENQFGGSHNWGKELTPGKVFTDKGLVSTTAHSKFAVGWLEGNATGDEERLLDPGDAVVEIRLPVGSRIVGGDPQFIETMLPPGTSLKVISSELRQGPGTSPLTHTSEDVKYHHIVAEVVQ